MKTGRLLALILCLCLLLPACSLEQETAAPYQVWMVAKSEETEFWRSALAGANAAKAEYNVDLTVFAPETEEDYEAQNEWILRAAEEGADAIVFSAISYTENADAIDRAAAEGVKIVVIDSDVASDHVGVRIGTDNIQAGRMAAQAALACAEGPLTVGIVNYDLGSRNGQERESGCREELMASGRVEAIHTINVLATPWEARMGVEELLRIRPDVNLLVALNEPLAVGAGIALENMARRDVKLVGFDTNVRCIDMMRTGTVSALIVQNPYAMGYLGVEYAWRLLEGESFDSQTLVDTATTIVTPENMFTDESQKALFSFG